MLLVNKRMSGQTAREKALYTGGAGKVSVLDKNEKQPRSSGQQGVGRSLASQHHHNITFRCLLAISSGYNTELFIRYIIVLYCIFIALEGEHSSPLREDLAEHAHLQEQKWWLF